MKRAGWSVWRFFGSFYVLIPLVVVAATSLAYYSYRAAAEMAKLGEQSIVSTTRAIGEITIDRIEKDVTRSGRDLVANVDLDHIEETSKRWEKLKDVNLTVESLVVVDRNHQIFAGSSMSKKKRAEAERFQEIAKDLDLSHIVDEEEPAYILKEYDGRHWLFGVVRRERNDKTWYIVIEIDIFYVVNDVFRRYFEPLEKDRYVQVLDDHDVHRWGNRFAHVEPRYEVVLPFQTILPGWKVRIAPQEAEALARREERRGLIDVILIGVSAIALFVGLGVMVIAVRAERRSNELKSEFIANVSHELKTPLSLIRMFGELLATGRTKGPEQEREYAEIITRESERLSRLIDNVLDFARIERGRVAYEFKLGDLAEVLSRGLDVYKWRLDREGMKLSVEMEHDLPPVRIDENALTLVLLNLVDNAVKYASEGKELRVSVKRQGDRVNLVVADRGPGIPQDERERVFERFYRSRNVRGRPVRGSGIGLSLVKHIAEAHGGGVELDSRLGEGSTFTVWLPVAPPEPDVGLIEGTEDELRSQEDPDHRGRAGHRARTS